MTTQNFTCLTQGDDYILFLHHDDLTQVYTFLLIWEAYLLLIFSDQKRNKAQVCFWSFAKRLERDNLALVGGHR